MHSPLGAGFGGSTFSGGAPSLPPYTLADLHADITRWPASYYSKQVRRRLLSLGEGGGGHSGLFLLKLCIN